MNRAEDYCDGNFGHILLAGGRTDEPVVEFQFCQSVGEECDPTAMARECKGQIQRKLL